jgi:hypothetical protein
VSLKICLRPQTKSKLETTPIFATSGPTDARVSGRRLESDINSAGAASMHPVSERLTAYLGLENRSENTSHLQVSCNRLSGRRAALTPLISLNPA